MQYQAIQQDKGLEIYEEKWVNLFLKTVTNSPSFGLSLTPKWAIRKSTEEFRAWLPSLRMHYLFFDGASHGNPRVTGAGGSLFSPRGIQL
jgi:hypothetical protein